MSVSRDNENFFKVSLLIVSPNDPNDSAIGALPKALPVLSIDRVDAPDQVAAVVPGKFNFLRGEIVVVNLRKIEFNPQEINHGPTSELV
jgi:hypothetical protein